MPSTPAPSPGEYLDAHAIDRALAREVVGWDAGKGALVFHYEREDGSTFDRRRPLDGKVTYQPKGEALALYWPLGRSTGKVALLCEGESDTLAAASVLEPSVHPLLNGMVPVGLPGASMNSGRVADELRFQRLVYVCLDGDEAGRSGAAKVAKGLDAAGTTPVAVGLPDGEDLSDFLRAEWNREAALVELLAGAETSTR